MGTVIGRVRGTRDIVEMRLFNFAVTTITKHLILNHYIQIELPILESVELFKRSLGIETDVVSKEMFIVSSSSAQSDESICLRPEATASTMRAFLENVVQYHTPWQVFSFGPMFRYERPQKGRFRQFYQCTIEVIGAPSLAHDVQLITLLDRLFSRTFMLDNYALHLNFLGTMQERAAFRQDLLTFLEAHKETLCQTCLKRMHTNALRVFDCKEQTCQQLYTTAPTLIESFGQESRQEWQTVRDQLEELSVSFTVNPRLVRGLDYYNKTVFEFVSPDLGAQTAFCGGGRYDSLALQLGAKEDFPSVGAAIGFDRLLMLLELMQDRLALPHAPALHIVMPVAPEQQMLALHLADALTQAGLCTQVLCDGSLKSMMRKANKWGAAYCLIIGEQEQKDGTVMLKEMIKGQEQVIKQVDAVKLLQKV